MDGQGSLFTRRVVPTLSALCAALPRTILDIRDVNTRKFSYILSPIITTYVNRFPTEGKPITWVIWLSPLKGNNFVLLDGHKNTFDCFHVLKGFKETHTRSFPAHNSASGFQEGADR